MNPSNSRSKLKERWREIRICLSVEMAADTAAVPSAPPSSPVFGFTLWAARFRHAAPGATDFAELPVSKLLTFGGQFRLQFCCNIIHQLREDSHLCNFILQTSSLTVTPLGMAKSVTVTSHFYCKGDPIEAKKVSLHCSYTVSL